MVTARSSQRRLTEGAAYRASFFGTEMIENKIGKGSHGGGGMVKVRR